MGAEALPPAVLEQQHVQQLQLENETLSAVVSIVSSSLDLQQVLARVVDLLTRATSCHACFIYLLNGEELRMRAASPIYGHLVGRIRFGLDEGLAGWSVRHGRPAFIRDEALNDPRTNYVPELEEEHFQSMVAVPIPARNEQPLGVIVLHTVAPREFDEAIITVLSRAAALVAGAIENAQLYEDVQRRVRALTLWTDLAQRMAAARGRAELYSLATAGARQLLPCDVCRLYELDADDRLGLVAADPPTDEASLAPGRSTRVVLDLLATPGASSRLPALGDALGLDDAPGAALALPVASGDEQRGVLVVAAREPWGDHATELARALGHLLAVALEKADLIERLMEENVSRNLFQALADGDATRAQSRARAAGFDLERPHVMVHMRPRDAPSVNWDIVGPRAERAMRASVPSLVGDLGEDEATFLIAANEEGPRASRELSGVLHNIAESHSVWIGISDGRRGARGAVQSATEASDASRLARVLHSTPSALVYRDAGAYRYLTHLLDQDGPRDHLREAVELLTAYDDRRQSNLVATLEAYLESGGAYAPTARALNIHVNTLRQRIQRAEEISGLRLADEDLLSLQLVIKLAKARASP